MYPFFSRRFKTYNNPLVQLSYLTYKAKQHKINVVDIGAATGDTILLIMKNCPEMINNFYCIEGDTEFFKYLRLNLEKYRNGILINELISDEDEKQINELIKIHLGTASSIGNKAVQSNSLDTILMKNNIDSIDLLKVDVDGLDGLILKGAKKIITLYHPNIIFEWHPIQYKKTNNDIMLPFQILKECGYSKFIWYDKYGNFSHYDFGPNFNNLEALSLLCLNNIHEYDWHYDVIAISNATDVSLIELAEMFYAKNKLSNY